MVFEIEKVMIKEIVIVIKINLESFFILVDIIIRIVVIEDKIIKIVDKGSIIEINEFICKKWILDIFKINIEVIVAIINIRVNNLSFIKKHVRVTR